MPTTQARPAAADVTRRTTAAMDDRRRKLAAIHAAATKLGLDTADKSPSSAYRQMLLAQAGVTSAASLDEAGRRKVLAYLLRLANPASPPKGKAATQLALIERLWAELGNAGALRDPSSQALDQFVRKTQRVDSRLWLTAVQGAQVIEALKSWAARHAAKA